MPLFVVYKDGTCDIEIGKVTNRNDIQLAVGGIGILPVLNFNGFKAHNTSSLSYATQRIAIGYNHVTNKICLISSEDKLTISEFGNKISKFGFKKVLGLDSGGSAQWKFDKTERLTTRTMIGWLYY